MPDMGSDAPPEKSSEERNTTISLKVETKERLKKFGEMGMSYDDLLNRLMDSFEKVHGQGKIGQGGEER